MQGCWAEETVWECVYVCVSLISCQTVLVCDNGLSRDDDQLLSSLVHIIHRNSICQYKWNRAGISAVWSALQLLLSHTHTHTHTPDISVVQRMCFWQIETDPHSVSELKVEMMSIWPRGRRTGERIASTVTKPSLLNSHTTFINCETFAFKPAADEASSLFCSARLHLFW